MLLVCRYFYKAAKSRFIGQSWGFIGGTQGFIGRMERFIGQTQLLIGQTLFLGHFSTRTAGLSRSLYILLSTVRIVDGAFVLFIATYSD